MWSNTIFFVSYVPTRPLALDRQTTTASEAGTTATNEHDIHTHFFKEPSQGKIHQTMRYGDECMPPLVSSVDTVYLLTPSSGAA